MGYQDIMWGLSTVQPCEIVTAKDMTPEQLVRARELALVWAGQNNPVHEKEEEIELVEVS